MSQEQLDPNLEFEQKLKLLLQKNEELKVIIEDMSKKMPKNSGIIACDKVISEGQIKILKEEIHDLKKNYAKLENEKKVYVEIIVPVEKIVEVVKIVEKIVEVPWPVEVIKYIDRPSQGPVEMLLSAAQQVEKGVINEIKDHLNAANEENKRLNRKLDELQIKLVHLEDERSEWVKVKSEFDILKAKYTTLINDEQKVIEK